MKNAEITIRQMTRPELDVAVEWAAAEGWNPGLHDADIFWQTDPDGFVTMERQGEMIGAGSIVSYGGHFGFMGFFIVRKDMRGLGLGTDLWLKRKALLSARLQPGASIGMDGVFDMQPFYKKGGFVLSHRNLRMECQGRLVRYDEEFVRPYTDDKFAALLKIDTEHFGFERATFLRAWLNSPDHRAFYYEDEGEVRGYAVIRKCLKGWKVGPLFARDSYTANHLFAAVNGVSFFDTLYLDVPENNPLAMDMADTYKLKQSFGCARMYAGQAPKLPWSQIYGVTTFELG